MLAVVVAHNNTLHLTALAVLVEVVLVFITVQVFLEQQTLVVVLALEMWAAQAAQA
jgi:hypothetical protein